MPHKVYYREGDEKDLSPEFRLALAYWRAYYFEWDEYFGPKPEGFDDMPKVDERRLKLFRRKIRTKADYVNPLVGIYGHQVDPGISRIAGLMFVKGLTEKEARETVKTWICHPPL